MPNIASTLVEQARLRPFAPAVVEPAGRERFERRRVVVESFRQLDRRSDAVAHALLAMSVAPGSRVVLMTPPAAEFFGLVFGLFKIGAVPVIVDPGMGPRNIARCLAEAEPQVFIGVRKALVARAALGWARSTLRRAVLSPRDWNAEAREALSLKRDEPIPPFPPRDVPPDETAAILFTSGSTGTPKGAVYTHEIFLAQLEAIRAIFRIEPGEIDLPTFPLFALFAPGLGMTSVLPEMDFTRPALVDPRVIFEALETFGPQSMFGSPALLHRVAEHAAASGLRLPPTLKRVLAAGAPVSRKLLQRLDALIPQGATTAIHTPYGATEAMPVAVVDHRAVLSETRADTDAGRGVCVGTPAPGVRVAIIPVTDDPIPRWSDDLPLPNGRVGEIVVSGPVVTPRYHNRPDADALAKIPDPARSPSSPWHRMGDVGYLDDRGRLWFCGRKSQRVRTPDGDLHTACCEEVFNAHPAVARSALVGIGQPPRQKPLVWIELARDPAADPHRNNPETLYDELRALARRHESTRSIVDFALHPAFPVDPRHNAKIARERLAEEAQRRFA